MRLGEVSLLTNQVIRMSEFYRALLEVEDSSDDAIHQTIIGQETMLTIYDDGSVKEQTSSILSRQNICIAFTVDDLEKEYEKVKILGAKIKEEPTIRPWGTRNMSFYDPDGNVVYLREYLNK